MGTEDDEGADVNLTTRGVLLREKQAAMNAPSLNVDVVSIAATINPHNTITNIRPKLPAMEMNNTCQMIYIRCQIVKCVLLHYSAQTKPSFEGLVRYLYISGIMDLGKPVILYKSCFFQRTKLVVMQA